MIEMSRREFLRRTMVAGASLHVHEAWALAADGSLSGLSIAEAGKLVRSRETTSVALVRALLARFEQYNPKLNAFITVMRESALREAALLDAEAAQGRLRGPLHGIPIAVKDNIDTAGTRTTVASMLFDDRVPKEDAFVVGQLRQAGAVLIGKTNLHEFAMGGSSVTSYFGPVRNAWALDREAGGSSGGSASALISELAMGAVGTDTGGSIRIPAAWCSVVGFKPTYGLVSLNGIFPLIYSLDHCGPMTRTVEDAALMLSAMVGYDRRDVASLDHAPENYVTSMQQVSVAGLRVGIPRAPFFDGLDPAIIAAVDAAVAVVTTLVKSVHDVELPATGDLDWTVIRAAEIETVHEDLFRRHAGNYSLQTRSVVEGVVRDLNDPGQTSASKMADLVRANWQLARLRKMIDDAFTNFDLVVLPTNRISPRTINEELKREEAPEPTEPENIFNSLAFNLYGIPALSLPCGFTPTGLPIGLTIAGRRFSEAQVLALAHAYERATPWHARRPSLSSTTVVPSVTRRQ